MMAEKIKVLVVDDSAFMRRVISDMVATDSGMEVVGIARDGLDAIDKAKKLHPDVITLDIEMPRMNGLEALEILTGQMRIPTIMFSSHTKEGAEITLTALEKGAFDFLPKPDNAYFAPLDQVQRDLIDRIRGIKKVNLGNLVAHKPMERKIVHEDFKRDVFTAPKNFKKLVAIGTSTGGPRALQEVVPYISGNIDASFLIVQHMPPNFTKSLAERLNGLSSLQVKEAEDGDDIIRGRVLIAPGNYHMLAVKKSDGVYQVRLEQSPTVEGHRPSATVMMDSVARTFGPAAIGVILTGMGGDGSDGMVSIKKAGGQTIAEDESTCVVFGMPEVAIKKQAVDYIVPLPKVSEKISGLV